MSDAPLSPSLKDLPKVASDLKSELQDFNTESMKTVNTTEKNVLPTAQGINAAAAHS
jgi:Thymosin beta-4 family